MRLPEAREIKNSVLKDKNFKLEFRRGSKGEDFKASKTTKRSHEGHLLGDLASIMEAPFKVSLMTTSSAKEGNPNCRRVVQMAALCTLTVEDDFPSACKLPRKFASSMLVGWYWDIPMDSHHRTHLDQWEAYTACVPFLCAAITRS